jgi:hypothetical protein
MVKKMLKKIVKCHEQIESVQDMKDLIAVVPCDEAF